MSCKKMPVRKQIEIDLGIEILDAIGRLQDVDDMLEQPAVIGVMGLDPGGCQDEVVHQLLVGQKAFDQRVQVRLSIDSSNFFNRSSIRSTLLLVVA